MMQGGWQPPPPFSLSSGGRTADPAVALPLGSIKLTPTAIALQSISYHIIISSLCGHPRDRLRCLLAAAYR